MGANPMQKKARSSFILGMLVMLLISGAIIAFLVISLMNLQNEKEQEELENPLVSVYVLKQNVSSGQTITTNMLEMVPVRRTTVPSNATNDLTIIQNYALEDEVGNEIYTEYNNDGIPQLKVTIDNDEFDVETDNIGGYYYMKNNEKIDLKLSSVPLVAKVNMNAKTVITTELLSKADSIVQDDMRIQEFNTISIPTDLTSGDYVDIRLVLPTGQDYIVVSKKEVEIPFIGLSESLDTIWLNLTEEETLYIECAIMDNFSIEGSKLYATKYTDPGLQEKAVVTYPPNLETMELVTSNPNILATAKTELIDRYSETNGVNFRNEDINPLINREELPAKVEESIINTQDTRKEYLDAISGQ